MSKYSVFGFFLLFCVLETVAIPNYYMNTNCGQTLEFTTSGQLKLTRFSKYGNNMDCTLRLRAPPGKRIMFTFRELDIESGLFGSCNDDYLEISDGKHTRNHSIPNLRSRLCGERRPGGSYLTTGRLMTLNFRSDWHGRDDGFKIVFTSFHRGTCNSSEFKCDAGQCIPSELKCDGYNQCGDYSDECGAKLAVGIIVGIVIAVVVILAVGAVVVFCIFRRRRRRQQGYVKRTSTPTTTTATPPTVTSPTYPQQGYPAHPYYPSQPAPYVTYNAGPAAPPPGTS